MIIVLLQSAISYCKATDGTIIINNQMPAKAVSVIATKSVVLTTGFRAIGTAGSFDAKTGTINSVYPLIPVAAGSTTILAPSLNENAIPVQHCVKTTVPFLAVTDVSQINSGNSLTSLEYTDGLGRTNMTVQKGVTPGKKDLVVVADYDCYGRLSNQWMPTPMVTSTTDPGMVMQQTQNFYADNMPFTTIANSEDLTADENSTDGQILQVCKPGIDWHNGKKTQKQELLVSGYNPLQPELFIRLYSVSANDAVVLTNDPYEYFMTSVLKTTDEDGHTSYIFSDVNGRTLLQRKTDNGNFNDTYYVYDDMGKLRYMLSPEASDRMSTPGTFTLGDYNTKGNPLSQYAYAYKYDQRGRCIAKKLPGKDWIKMMYDQADHLIFSQDGNQRTSNTNIWTYYKYDALNRIIQSGTTTILDANAKQNDYNSITSVETYVTGTGYTSNSPLGTNTVLLTQNFYDSYDYLTIPVYTSTKLATLPANTSIKSALTFDATTTGFDAKYSNVLDGVDIATYGKLTGTTVAMLDNSITLFNAIYYDDRGRVVQIRTNNHLKGYDYEYFHYNFSGQVLNKRHIHNSYCIPSPVTENYRLQFDNANRLITVHYALNTQNEILMDSLVYDELGRVSRKILHGGIQTINYAYNIHNNLNYISSKDFTEDLFYQDSPYSLATPSPTPCYNGNISASSFSEGSIDKAYCYTYDKINRLKSAKSISSYANYDEEVTNYDKNGNMLGIKRNGYVYGQNYAVNPGPIDDLQMDYNGNQLNSVSDAVDQSKVITTNDFVDKQGTKEYVYDANGNQTANLNKGIAWIQYNLINLPQKVQFQNGTKNEYLYDASGVKHRAGYNYSTRTSLIPLEDTSQENTAPSTVQTNYCGNYVYEKSGAGEPILKRILTPEGYIETYSTTPLNFVGKWIAVYCLKDHLGNTRKILKSDFLSNNTSKVYSATYQIDYYPFGMELSNTGQTSGGPLNSGSFPYLYSGKEIDRMNGLNQYDFSARWLDNAVPGFTTSDPLAERHPDESPYLYCGNNPVNRVDPTGLQWYTKEGGSNTDFFFFKDKSINPYISGGVRYNLAGETVSAYVGDDGKFTYFKKGDKFGNVTDEKCVNVASTTVTGINLSLASGGGNYNNTAPDRSSGNNGNSNSGQKSETSFINKTVNYYEISKPVIDITTTVLTSKFPQLKGLGPITTGLDFVKDSYLFFDSEVITGKRYSYRAVGAGLALLDVPLAGPSFAVGEIMFDKLSSITSWINNAFTTQNILDSDYFPH